MQKSTIFPEIKKHTDFVGFLIDQGLDPSEEENHDVILDKLSFLKRQFKAGE